MRVSPLAAFAGLSLLWGSGWLLVAAFPMQPHLRGLAIEYAVSAVILLPAVIRRRHRRPIMLVRTVMAGLGILCIPQVLIFLGASKMPQLVSVVALSFTPVILAVAGRLAIPIGVSGFAGVLFLVSNSLGFSVTQLPWLVLPASAAAVLAWSLDSAEKRLPQMSVAENVFWSTATAAILLLVCSLLLEPEPVVWSTTSVVGFIVCGAITTCCSYLIFYWLLGKSGAARVSMLQWTQPLIASAEGALLMRITPSLVAIAGAILIIFTVAYAFSNRGEFKGVMTEITQR